MIGTLAFGSGQLALKLKTAHPRHLHIEDQASRVIRDGPNLRNPPPMETPWHDIPPIFMRLSISFADRFIIVHN